MIAIDKARELSWRFFRKVDPLKAIASLLKKQFRKGR